MHLHGFERFYLYFALRNQIAAPVLSFVLVLFKSGAKVMLFRGSLWNRTTHPNMIIARAHHISCPNSSGINNEPVFNYAAKVQHF